MQPCPHHRPAAFGLASLPWPARSSSHWLHSQECFPPDLPSVCHLAINSLAQPVLPQRGRLSRWVLHSVFDFEALAPPPDDFSADLRPAMGLAQATGRPFNLPLLCPTDESVAGALRLLEDDARKADIVEQSFRLAREHFSYTAAERRRRGVLKGLT
jgi:hypothetical protein